MAKEQAATIRRLHKLLTQHGLTGQIGCQVPLTPSSYTAFVRISVLRG
jgi:hypothetical protein